MDISECQNRIASWSEKNFPADEIGGKIHPELYTLLTLTLHRFGEACHAALKTEQGIRGSDESHRKDFVASMLDVNHQAEKISELVEERAMFANQSNYADPDSHRPIRKLFGVVEECAELVSAYNMGHNADVEEVEDSIADIFIFLCDLADSLDIDMERVIGDTLDDVLDRDWRSDE